MGGDLIIWGKLLLAVFCMVLGILLCRWNKLFILSDSKFMFLASSLVALTRLGFFVIIYVVLNINVPSDLPSYYVPQGHAVLSGLMPYRDFNSSYAPGFGYIVAIILSVWDSPKAIVLFTIVTEIISIPLWISASRAVFTERQVRYGYLLYISNGLPLVIAAIAGQNQLWINLLLAVSWFFMVVNRPFLSGLAIGSSIVLVKILGVLFSPILWLACHQKYTWTAGFFLPLLIYFIMAASGIDILVPVHGEIDKIFSGNIPYLLVSLGIDWAAKYAVWMLIFMLISLFLYVYIKFPSCQNKSAWFLTSLVAILFMLVSKKSPTNYLSMFLFILSVTVAMTSSGWKGILSFGVFGLIATLEPTLWFRWVNQSYVNVYDLFNDSMPAEQVVKTLGFLFLELLLIAFYVKYVIASWLALLKFKTECTGLPKYGESPT